MSFVERLGQARSFVGRLRLGRFGTPAIRLARALPAIVATYAYFRIPSVRASRGEFYASAIWSALLVVSYVGWGRFLGARLFPGRRFGWGLDAAFGIALSIAVGGVLMTMRKVSAPFVVAWTLAGIAALCFEALRAPAKAWRPRRWAALVRRKVGLWSVAAALFVVFALFLVRFGGALSNIDFNPWDDNMAYRGFARQILDSGTLVEPFSYHRIGSLGGQSLLHAMVLAVGGATRLHVVDDGICMLVLGGLVVGYEGRRRMTRAAVLLALVMLVTLPHRPHNIQSELSGVLFFFALFRVLDSEMLPRGRPIANALAVGMLAAALCTLRQNYMLPCAAFVAFHYASTVVAERGTRRRWIVETVAVALATILFLLPWAIVSFQTARTFFYPVMKGTTNPEFGILGKVGKSEELRWMIQNFFFCWPIRAFPLYVLAAIVVAHRGRTRALHALLFATLFGFATLVHFFQAFDLIDSLARYYFAFAVAFALAATLKAGEETSRRRGITLAFAMVAACGVIQVFDTRDKVVEVLNVSITTMEKERLDKLRANDMTWLKADDFYHRMQETVPAGERLLIMADETFRFDGKRNQIWNYDQPGAMSPRPGLPYFQGPEAYAKYFLSIGVRYISFVISEKSPEYKVTYWTSRRDEPDKKTGRGLQYKTHARYYLDAFDALGKLAKTRKILFQESDYWVLDLATREPTQAP